MISRRGYALSAVGFLAGCGPAESDSNKDSGFPVTGLDVDESGSADADSAGNDDDGAPEPECTKGSVCGEKSICSCYSDIDEFDCGCEPAECTEDVHCEAGFFCDLRRPEEARGNLVASCEFDECTDDFDLTWTEQMPPVELDGVTCVGNLVVDGISATALDELAAVEYIEALTLRNNPNLVDLSALDGLEDAHVLNFEGNASLTSVDFALDLHGLESLIVRNNPSLDGLDLRTRLEAASREFTWTVCGNLNDPPCE